jgi:hypothetical protein
MHLQKLTAYVRSAGTALIMLLVYFGAIHLFTSSERALGAPALNTDATSETVPAYLNYQGTLRDPEGNPLSGHYDMLFRIYDDVTAPTSAALWEEQHISVTVRSGHFSVLLGNNTSIPPSAFDGPDRFIGVTVDPYDEMVPRQRLASVPYALHTEEAYNASRLDGQPSSAFAAAGHRHSSLDGSGGGPQNALAVDSSGHVNVNSAGAALTVKGNDPDLALDLNSTESANLVELKFMLDGETKSRLYWSKPTDKTFLQHGGGTPEITVQEGRVGIGIASPSTTLDVNGDLMVRGNILNFAVAGPFLLESVNGANPPHRDLGAIAERVCFISKAGFSNLDDGNEIGFCEVFRNNGRWWLKASTTPNDDNDAYCAATCLTW